LAYTVDSDWRKSFRFPVGRAQIKTFLHKNGTANRSIGLVKEVVGFTPRSDCGEDLLNEVHDEKWAVVSILRRRKLGIMIKMGNANPTCEH